MVLRSGSCRIALRTRESTAIPRFRFASRTTDQPLGRYVFCRVCQQAQSWKTGLLRFSTGLLMPIGINLLASPRENVYLLGRLQALDRLIDIVCNRRDRT